MGANEMKIFNDKDGKLKKLTKIILDIEKEKDTIGWANSSINSCLWNLEGNPKLEMHDREWIVKDLRENLNKKEIAVARLEELKNGDLKIEMGHLNIINSPNGFLQNLEEMKKKMGINNFWKEAQYKKWDEDIKKHPEKLGTLHITEDSFTFDFSNKKKQ